MAALEDHPSLSDWASHEDKLAQQAQHDATQTDGSEQTNKEDESAPKYAGPFQLTMIMCTINLSTLIASLDLGIVATAIPSITNEFHSLNDIGWYSGMCFILVGATSAMWGKLFTYLSARWVFIVSLIIYIIGSIVAAAAPNSNALIVARAIQGVGCSGTLAGSVIIINYTSAPKHRPLLIGIWMGVFMAATILGPLLGGVFTTEATWRWCFWVNLPIGGLALAMQLIFLRIPKHIKPAPATWKEILLHLDFPGLALILSALICYTLALQWGGLTKAWRYVQSQYSVYASNGSVVATLVMFGVLMIAFVVCEWLQGSYAMIPMHLFKPRTFWTQALFIWIYNGPAFLVLFFLPLYFQSVKGTSAIMSGVYQLPYVAFYALGALISGGIIGNTRQVQPIELAGALFGTLGAALVYELDANTSKAWFIGAQIPFGFGLGLGVQAPVIALQGFSKPENAAVITGALFVFQTISGAYFNTAGNSLMENRMLETLARDAPSIDTEAVLRAGASGIWQTFKGEDLDAVVNAYMVGIKDVFAFMLAGVVCSVIVTLLIPFKRIPIHENQKTEDVETAA